MSEKTTMQFGAVRHVKQTFPYEWKAVENGNDTFILHDVPEGTVACYRLEKVTRNVRVIAQADAVLWNGVFVEPVYDRGLKHVELSHRFGGIRDQLPIEERVDPVPILARLEMTKWGKVEDYE